MQCKWTVWHINKYIIVEVLVVAVYEVDNDDDEDEEQKKKEEIYSTHVYRTIISANNTQYHIQSWRRQRERTKERGCELGNTKNHIPSLSLSLFFLLLSIKHSFFVKIIYWAANRVYA